MANSAKELQMRELKDSICKLNILIKTLQKTIIQTQEREDLLRQERDNFKAQVDFLTKKLFGSSSEKGVAEIPGQINLFNEAETLQDPVMDAGEEEAAQEPLASERKHRCTNEDRFKGRRVETIYLDLPENEHICSDCQTPLEKIGTEFVRRELHYVPAKVKVLEYYSVNYGCPSCRERALVPHIVKGKDGQAHMLHGMASASIVAWIIGNADECFGPMYDYFRRKLLARQFVMADETPLQVLHEPGRREETKSYMWLFRSGEDGEIPIILYKYSRTRAGDTAVDFLSGFCGYLMCDGYSGCNKVPDARRTACFPRENSWIIPSLLYRALCHLYPKPDSLSYDLSGGWPLQLFEQFE